MNSHLVEYGIHTEASDLRAHVCVNAGIVYVFPTMHAVALLEAPNDYEKRPASQPGTQMATAEGYLVPPSDIPYCTPINARRIIQKQNFNMNDDTSVKGQKAVAVVTILLKAGWFSLPVNPLLIDNITMQINGLDVVVCGDWKIQVKCDYKGGEPFRHLPRITGNLFLQVAECNPFRRT